MIRWDWYQGTPREDVSPMIIFDRIASEIDDAHRIHTRRHGQNGYAYSAHLVDKDDYLLAVMNYEGNRGAKPNLRGTGPSAPAFANALRKCYPRHNVTRADACSDLLGADFSAIRDKSMVLARQARTSGLRHVPDDPERGETYTIGAKSSASQTRIYRKDLELIRKGVSADEFPQPIVRIEQQINPKGENLRLYFSHAEPAEIFGASRIGRAMAATFLNNNPAAISMTRRPPTSFDIRSGWLAKQAGGILGEIRQRFATPEEICRYIYVTLLDQPEFDSTVIK